MLRNRKHWRRINKKLKHVMLCCGRKKGREATLDIATSPRRQNPPHGTNNTQLRPKDPPSMVIQGDFRKVSGISNEIYRQIETIENEYDASTAAALEAVERRGEMIVRILDVKHLGKAAADAAKKFLNLQDAKHSVYLVEIIKRPGQTLGLYIREGNGLDRHDGVFISRIALESAVYNSGCIQVADEILAVNLVDVTRMSIDDVVIIMSIPRRLILVTRQLKGYPSCGTLGSSGGYGTLGHARSLEPKPPPVVVIKKDLSKEEYDDEDDERMLLNSRNEPRRNEHHHPGEKSRSQYALDSNGDMGTDLYYNSRPEPRHQTSTLDRKIGGWTYTPSQSNIMFHSQQSESNYERNYPKTLESLAEKVHPYNPGGSTLGRRTSDATVTSKYPQSGRKYGMTRSGSDQHLPRTEYDDFRRTLPNRQSHTLARSSLRSGATTPGYARQYSAGSSIPSNFTSTLPKNHTLDYASDTEASYPSISKSSSYYYCKPNTPQAISGISSSTLSRLTKSSALGVSSSLRSNSLPRDSRILRNQLSSLPVSSTPSAPLRQPYGSDAKTISNFLDQEDEGILSAPELPESRKFGKPNSFPTSSVFTSDEYRAWLTRTPSTSAIYDRLRSNRELSLMRQKGRFTFSAENLPERTKQSELIYSGYRGYRPGYLSSMDPANTTPLPSATITTLDRHTRTSSLRRIKHLQELEAKHLGNRSMSVDVQVDRSRVLEINAAEFTKYKIDKTQVTDEYPTISGLLWIHLLAGRGLRVSGVPTTTHKGVGGSGTRDLYCVLECDRVHKARTVVRNGDLVFDWDETFELDLFGNKDLDMLIYSWDPQYRHKLCYKGVVHLSSLLHRSPIHQLAIKLEPRGTLFIRLRHTTAFHTYLRKPSRPLLPSRSFMSITNIFGADLESVVNKEAGSISSSLQSLPQAPLAVSVPIILRRCIEEVERRGLDIIGLYRLCGSATKKRILREAFERNARAIDLTPDNVPDINVITGVLKDYLRELPEPLFTKRLYQMIVDALSVCMSDDPQGNAKLIFSLLDCLSRINRATLIFVMDHLSLVTTQAATNKMTSQNLAVIFAPLLMIKSETEHEEIDFNQPTNILRYLLEIWPSKSVREIIAGPVKISAVHTVLPPPLPRKLNAGSGPVGGPPPVPSKGIRRLPPAVPARCTQAAVVSQTTVEHTTTVSSTTSSSSDDAGTVISLPISRRVDVRSTDDSSNGECHKIVKTLKMAFEESVKDDGKNYTPVKASESTEELGDEETDYKRSADGVVEPTNGDRRMNGASNELESEDNEVSRGRQPTEVVENREANNAKSLKTAFDKLEIENEIDHRRDATNRERITSNTVENEGETNRKTDACELLKCEPESTEAQEPWLRADDEDRRRLLDPKSRAAFDAAKVNEARHVAAPKTSPKHFGHSRIVDSTEPLRGPDTSGWSAAEPWLRDFEDDADASDAIEAFRRTRKNPFLGDMGASVESSFERSFSFCVDAADLEDEIVAEKANADVQSDV